MKSNQSSVGREMELFYSWLVSVSERIPKGVFCLRESVCIALKAIVDAKTFVDMALRTQSLVNRLDLIASADVQIQTIKTVMNVLIDYSNKDNHPHFISHKQRGQYLKQMESICLQLGGWSRKTNLSIKQSNAATNKRV